MTGQWNTQRNSSCHALDEPSRLIAVLPALLGFAPRDSLVVVTLTARPPKQVGYVLRVDLDGLTDETLARIRPLLAVEAEESGTGDFALVVLGGGKRSDYLALCARFVERALPFGSRLSMASCAASTGPGAVWQSLIGPRAHGFVADPRALPAYAAGVLRGDVLAHSREQLRELLEPHKRDQGRTLLAMRRLTRDGLFRRSGVAAAAVSEMLEAIRLPQRPAQLAPEQAARFAVALGERGLRNRLISATVEAAETGLGGAELLWSRLVPALPDAERAEAAVLLALAWYARGRGAAARVALETALDAAPGHELAQLLEACLFTGVRPSALRVLVQRGG
ncbi:DUF4192 domain-containing protein [Segniliparus rugosus]|uniref:DUF4192 domain-containing protein n=1 Tax=Segniliparus rugosus (strain ATCC BAA-974 / DSM 45345 / CCUG 50838 / CIP 108380 / JCM 13579 / CDC 945) TaxID=679197 RepID=E5XMC7_SEGRC|nr:DUF4192 domain-containing protein [Segniliparus rugosus]EFV14506.1 hypothetical protein HMPREF9336_00647 [Segniliparus rugosus ATCC BAA-974]